MKVTKYVHSCLLVEEGGKKILIDPGIYSTQEHAISAEMIDELDYIAITHEHQDHMDVQFIKELVKKFSEVIVISNSSVAKILDKEGIAVKTKGDNFITIQKVLHEELFMGPGPENIMVTINGKLSHPGDSHRFETKAPILALPVAATWGSTTAAVKLAAKLKPKVVIPIHDWHWSEKGRQVSYGWLETYFKDHNIRFLPLETGKEGSL